MATTDRASVFEAIQIGKESVAGTAVAPTRKLGSMSIDPSYQTETSQFRPKGYKFDTVSSLNREWSEAGIEGVASYNELQYALASICGNVSPTTPGGATDAREWLFSISTSNPDTPATYTLEAGSSVRSQRATHLVFTEFGMTIERTGDGVTIDGAAMMQRMLDDKIRYIKIVGTGGTFTISVGAQTTAGIAYNAATSAVLSALEALSNVAPGDVTVGGTAGNYTVTFGGVYADAAVPTTTVSGASLTGPSAAATISRLSQAATEEAIIPVLPTQIEVRIADTHAGLDSGDVLTRLLSLSWNISDRWGPIWTVNRNVDSWADKVELDPSSEVTFMVGADDQGMAFLGNLRKGTTKFLRVNALGDEIESGINYELTMDFAVKITEIGDLSDEDGLVATEYTAVMTHDATWGKALEIALVNKATAL